MCVLFNYSEMLWISTLVSAVSETSSVSLITVLYMQNQTYSGPCVCEGHSMEDVWDPYRLISSLIPPCLIHSLRLIILISVASILALSQCCVVSIETSCQWVSHGWMRSLWAIQQLLVILFIRLLIILFFFSPPQIWVHITLNSDHSQCMTDLSGTYTHTLSLFIIGSQKQIIWST